MEVRLQPDKEAQLAQVAAQRGLNPDELVQQVLSRYLEGDAHFMEAVNLGLTPAERRDFVEHEEVESGLGTDISTLFTNAGIEFDIPELRGHQIKLLSSK
jgi:predicted transcriptional regulator